MAYLVVLHVVHEEAVDLEEPIPILQPPALGQPPQLDLPDDVALAAQLLVQAEAEGLCAALAQQVEAGFPHGLAICVGTRPMNRTAEMLTGPWSPCSSVVGIHLPAMPTGDQSCLTPR